MNTVAAILNIMLIRNVAALKTVQTHHAKIMKTVAMANGVVPLVRSVLIVALDKRVFLAGNVLDTNRAVIIDVREIVPSALTMLIVPCMNIAVIMVQIVMDNVPGIVTQTYLKKKIVLGVL